MKKVNQPGLQSRIDVVHRLMTGESAADIAASMNVSVQQVEQWAREFHRAGENRLRQLPDNLLERCLVSAEKLVPLATLISVLLAVTLFVQGQHKEAVERARMEMMQRESRVRDAYTALDDKYLEYLKTCLEHPELDVFDTPMNPPPVMVPETSRREGMMLSMLLSILERAYLMYSNPSDGFEHNQWQAWSTYMKDWSARKNFRAEWEKSRADYDPSFANYLDRLIKG